MTTKLNLNRLVRLQRMFSELYRESPLISIDNSGVHIQGLHNLRDLVPAGYELTTKQRGMKEYPYESHFILAGVIFYAIHKEATA